MCRNKAEYVTVVFFFFFFFFFCGEGDKCILYLRCGPLDRLSKFFFSRKFHLIQTGFVELKGN